MMILSLLLCSLLHSAEEATPPNIVLIVADDLGLGELGAYGQTKIKTPRLDQLAREGMRFTNFYSGSPVCAPARCVLLTGKHSGHAAVRANYELGGWGPEATEGQLPLAANEVTIAELLQPALYWSAAIGKWGLGGPGSVGHPLRQGFDSFYGYLCQRVAHNHYPTHLWRNELREELPGNDYFDSHQKWSEPPARVMAYSALQGRVYAPDRLLDEALAFLDRSAPGPFFLYYATTIPHMALQVPDDSLAEYRGRLDATPYLGSQGYLPHPEPRAAYAAMVTRLDRDVGILLDHLRDLGLAHNTLVLFSSDNGPTYNGGTDSTYFESTQGLRGRKGSLWEGGIRVPLIVRWPGRIAEGSRSAHLAAFQDILPTLAEVCGQKVSAPVDGLSFLPTLLGGAGQVQHDCLYWEYSAGQGEQALRSGRYKLLRRGLMTSAPPAPELYDLETDPNEQRNIALEKPELVAQLTLRMAQEHVPSKEFPLTPLEAR